MTNRCRATSPLERCSLPAPPARPTASDAGLLDSIRSTQQSTGCHRRDSIASRLQPDSLSRDPRTLHGLYLFVDREKSVDDGAGSEGALTKGPFNALLPIHDLNAILTSMILTGLGGFSTAAGHIGPEIEVGHDISMLVPEIWCRLLPRERDPNRMIAEGLLEKIEDYQFEGRTIRASRLGYRITSRFVRHYFGRVFDNPSKVFDERILRPEVQDPFRSPMESTTLWKLSNESPSSTSSTNPTSSLAHR